MGGVNRLVNGLTQVGVRVAAGFGICAVFGFAHAQDMIPSADGKLQLPAFWYKVASAHLSEGPRPAVLALHGCGGALDAKGRPNPIWQRYAGYFNAERIHFVVLDSFTPRGEKSICSIPNKQRHIKEADRRADVFAALDWLALQPGVDANRIMVVGWSHGAQAALTANDASNPVVQNQKIRPKAVAAFYPGCFNSLQESAYAPAVPLLVMAGEKDDWTPAHRCVALRDAVLKRQADRAATAHHPSNTSNVNLGSAASFELEVYPDSYHGFDSLTPVRTLRNVGNTPGGTATAGENPAARKASHGRLFEFAAKQFGEPLRLSHEDRMNATPAVLTSPSAVPKTAPTVGATVDLIR